MNQNRDFKEFYQKSIIPMREEDKKEFCKKYCNDCDNCIKANRWLVALEGSPVSKNSEVYEWKVVVYPANEKGIYWRLKKPYYKTEIAPTIERAIELSRKIESMLLNNSLTAESMLA